jgi:hypothetical protein
LDLSRLASEKLMDNEWAGCYEVGSKLKREEVIHWAALSKSAEKRCESTNIVSCWLERAISAERASNVCCGRLLKGTADLHASAVLFCAYGCSLKFEYLFNSLKISESVLSTRLLSLPSASEYISKVFVKE